MKRVIDNTRIIIIIYNYNEQIIVSHNDSLALNAIFAYSQNAKNLIWQIVITNLKKYKN